MWIAADILPTAKPGRAAAAGSVSFLAMVSCSAGERPMSYRISGRIVSAVMRV
jgi:hypothetical protein